jgi:hypothetical protein
MSARPSTSRFDLEQVVWEACEMMATGKPDALALVTSDVEMEGPMGLTVGRERLRHQLSDWQDGLTSVEVVVDRMAVDGAVAVVEWHLDGRHTGMVFLMEDELFEPTGNRVVLEIRSEVEFRGERICSLRNDYELDALLEQLRPKPREVR